MNQKAFNSYYLGLGCLTILGVIVLYIVFQPVNASAQDQATITMLERIEKLGKETDSYTANVTTRIEKDGKITIINGKIKFKWPNMRWQEDRHPTKDGFRIGLIISNGHMRWNYMPSLNLALKYDMAALGKDARQKGWISADYFEEGSLKYLGSEQLEGQELYVFEGRQKDLGKPGPSREFGTAQMYINVNDGTVRKFVTYDQQGRAIISQTFSNIRKDVSISANDFEFTPPEGTQVREINEVGLRNSQSE